MEKEAEGFKIDLDRAVWRKSTRSGPYSDNCVEVALIGRTVAVRDSKNPDRSPLVFTSAEWGAFVSGAKVGEFDLF